MIENESTYPIRFEFDGDEKVQNTTVLRQVYQCDKCKDQKEVWRKIDHRFPHISDWELACDECYTGRISPVGDPSLDKVTLCGGVSIREALEKQDEYFEMEINPIQ